MNKQLILINHLFNICTFIALEKVGTCPDSSGQVPASFKPALQQLQLFILRQFKDQGISTSVKYLKEARRCFIAYISGTPVKAPQVPMHLGRDGLPTFLSGFRPQILAGDQNTIRVLLTYLSIGRAIPGDGVVVDTSSITDESKVTIPEGFEEWLNTTDLTFGVDSYYTSCEWSKYHYSTKSGPNGLALATSLQDLSKLAQTHPQLLEDIVTITGNDEFRQHVENMKPLSLHNHPDDKALKIRKLSVIKDKEMKNRVIAILDYWSQTALKPFHNTFLKLLKAIPQDRTYNQDPFNLKCYDKYYSYDLKNATDRFPLQLQTMVMKKFVSEERAEAWARVLVGEPYTLKDKPCYYKAGQPMGAYSSWPTFAFCHHLILHFIMDKLNVQNRDCYIMLGDDIVISDTNVATNYVATMESLGVEISWSKTLVSKDTYEFAKRLLFRGIEVSPFPILDLYENISKPFSLVNTFTLAKLKGWSFTDSIHGVPDREFFTRILRKLNLSKRYRTRVDEIIWLIYNASLLSHNYVFEGENNEIARITARNVAESLRVHSCNKDPLLFIKEHFYPFVQELKVMKMRKAFQTTQALDNEATVIFAALSNSVPSEVTDQVPVQDLQQSWPIIKIIHDVNIQLTDAIAESHLKVISTPRDILTLGEDIVLPDINKYSDARRHSIKVNAEAPLYRDVFLQWVYHKS